MRRTIIFLLCIAIFAFLTPTRGFSQDAKGVISATIIDSATRKPVTYASVSVFRAADTVLLTYRLSDDKGGFRIPSLPVATRLRLVVTFIGYAVHRKEFQLTAEQPQLNLGNIALNPSLLSLDEVMIRAERPPVMVRKDTIEFNAASFKTLPDALVEDLLRKLPGVNVDKDGNIVVNGRRVSTIYVDGKDFFGGDPKIATRNLPANTIEKVQVSNDQEALKVNPFLPEAEIPQVINLKLKPGIKKGAFGKLYAGGGVRGKAEAGGLLNIFRDTTQVSLLGYGNNLNKAGFAFADLRTAGGFGRSGWGTANGNGAGGLNIDGVPFGGYGSGVIRSGGGGANFNTMLSKKLSFSLNYFYGVTNSDYDELRNTLQTYSDTSLNTRRTMTQGSKVYGHMIGTKVKYQFSPRVTLEFRPSLLLNGENTGQVSFTNSISSIKGLASESTNNQRSDNDGYVYRHVAILNVDFKEKGRRLFAFNFMNADDSGTDQYNLADNRFYEPVTSYTLNQLRRTDAHNLNNQVLATYTDPLSKTITFNASFSGAYFSNRNNVGTYTPGPGEEYTVLLPAFSQDFMRKGVRVNPGASVRWSINKLTITPGIGFQLLTADNHFSSSPVLTQRFFYWLPQLDIARGILSASYQRRFSEPAAANLQPVANNTNPLLVRQGNPALKPMLSDYLTLGLRKYDTQRLATYYANVNATFNNNATILSRTVSQSGVQTTYPINAGGTWALGSNLSFQKDKKFSENRQFSLIVSNSLSFNRSLVLLNSVRSDYSVLNLRPSGEFRLNLNDKFELNEAYSFTRYNSRYESAEFSSQSLTYHDSRSELILRPGAGNFVWETTMDYRYNSNAIPGLLKSYYRWNAAVTYIFLKGRRGQLKLAVNDILDQNIVASRVVRENLTEDMQGSTIRRYGLLTFTYNIRSFGEKVGGRNQLFKF
ncbi:outer membrane beta-barrel protein [Hufsiella ginkgonis]|uniref:TonB-dependent receptor n=1 Tax=Hufsiella ginkgonis TaxID=2695274 RepID=A0A7K1XU82_9SPHI|nr:outer membrane beta-barrel protein [Hufsiella ginkgonis]MXV14510.1 TonB-dependent receptor [Hufsiella ginkgonis]